MKGKTAQKKRKWQVVETTPEENSTSSAKESGSTGALIPGSGAANVVAGCADDSDVVDLSGLHDEALVARIVKKVPIFLGFKAARYDTKFFKDVAGLCGSGPDVNDVPTSDDRKISWKTLFPPKVGDRQVSRV